MRRSFAPSLAGLLISLQACMPSGKGGSSEESAAPPETQPDQGQPGGDEQKDPTLADQYVDSVAAGMINEGAKKEDVEALSAAVKSDLGGTQASLSLQGGPDFNDPKVVFEQVPGMLAKHAIEQKLDALFAQIIDQSAQFIGEKMSADKKEELFGAFSKSLLSESGETQIAASVGPLMAVLAKVVPEDAMAAVAPEFFGGLFKIVEEVQPGFVAKHIEKFADAAKVGDSELTTTLFGKSLEVAKNFVPAEKLAASLDTLNNKAMDFIATLPKDEIAEKMAKINTAILEHVSTDVAASLQAKIQGKIAEFDESVGEDFKDKLEQKLKEHKIDQAKIDTVNTESHQQLKCPEGTEKTPYGCKPKDGPNTTDPTTDGGNDDPTPPSLYWVFDGRQDPAVHAQFPKEKLTEMFGFSADLVDEYLAGTLTCIDGQPTFKVVYVDDTDEIARSYECYAASSTVTGPILP